MFRRRPATEGACLKLAACAALLLMAMPAAASGQEAPHRPVLEAFWGGSPSAGKLPWEMINTISYFFASPADGHCSAPTPKQKTDIDSLAAIKRAHPDLTVLISVGGWAAPGYSADAASAASRRKFVASCVSRWLDPFPAGLVNGFDVDWEFPVSGGLPAIGASPADRDNLNRLLVEFRTQLERYAAKHGLRKPMMLSIDIPAGRRQDDGTGKGGAPFDQAHSYDLRTVGRLVDIFNLMTYDLCTGYSPVSCFNEPLVQRPGDPNDKYNNVAGAVEYMRAHGVPLDKIVLGVGFYGRWFKLKPGDSDSGLYQPYTDTAQLPYTQAIGPQWAGNPGFQQGWDSVVRAPYLWNPKTHIWVSYQNPRSILDRSLYAKAHGLAGMMMWQIGYDDAQHSLLTAMTAPWLQFSPPRENAPSR